MSKEVTISLKNVLCIRADNMGDLLMSSPAFRALKETFNCKLSVLTSTMGSLITPFIPEIDETIVADVPWVKTETPVDEFGMIELIQKLTCKAFDAAIIFTVYSQNPLPAAILSFLAGISMRVAYCRENPYQLLTHWIPDEEPYQFIQHQVERDLRLVEQLGATVSTQSLSIRYSEEAAMSTIKKLENIGLSAKEKFLIFHPGVSEDKRKYPTEKWIEAGKLLLQKHQLKILITGSQTEEAIAKQIQAGIGSGCYSAAGILSVEELIAAIGLCHTLVSVNTGTIHIAAALQKQVVVLYALTNPQHTPWQTPAKILYFPVKEELKSKNPIIRYVSEHLLETNIPDLAPADIVQAIEELF